MYRKSWCLSGSEDSLNAVNVPHRDHECVMCYIYIYIYIYMYVCVCVCGSKWLINKVIYCKYG